MGDIQAENFFKPITSGLKDLARPQIPIRRLPTKKRPVRDYGLEIGDDEEVPDYGLEDLFGDESRCNLRVLGQSGFYATFLIAKTHHKNLILFLIFKIQARRYFLNPPKIKQLSNLTFTLSPLPPFPKHLLILHQPK